MKTAHWAAVIGLTIVAGHASIARSQDSPPLPKKFTDAIDKEIIPAWREENPLRLLKAVGPLTASATAQQLAGVDLILKKSTIPSLAELIARARVALIGHAAQKEAPSAKASEVLIALPFIHARLRTMLDEIAADSLLQRELPTYKIDDYDAPFQRLAALDERLMWIGKIVDFTGDYAVVASKSPPEKLSPEQVASLKIDHAAYARDIANRRREVKEREIELRIQRVDQALQVLAESKDFVERLHAVHAFDTDGLVIDEFYDHDEQTLAKHFVRPSLAEPGIAAKVKKQVEKGRKDGGDLVMKSRLLYAGLTMWLRGRYGTTNPSGGWLKSVESLRPSKQPDPLYMPRRPIEPTAPTNLADKPLPAYDRRHHYTWIWENAKFLWSKHNYSGYIIHIDSQLGPVQLIGPCHCGGEPAWMIPVRRDSTIWTRDTTTARLILRDPIAVARVVGFDEYRQALIFLEALVNKSSPPELEAYDAIVSKYKEFTVFTNLSRTIEKNPSPVSETSKDSADDFGRRGLGWVMALARVEYAAMLAIFTRQPRPFESLPPTAIEVQPYIELIRDGARTHYWALQNDNDLVRIVRHSYDERLLAFGNRTLLARRFIGAASRVSAKTDTPAQQATWKQWDEELFVLERAIARRIAWILSERTTNSSVWRDVHNTWTNQLKGMPAIADAIASARQNNLTVDARPKANVLPKPNTQPASTPGAPPPNANTAPPRPNPPRPNISPRPKPKPMPAPIID